jgi:hypothetical protein
MGEGTALLSLAIKDKLVEIKVRPIALSISL